jgi:hypothetical protein
MSRCKTKSLLDDFKASRESGVTTAAQTSNARERFRVLVTIGIVADTGLTARHGFAALLARGRPVPRGSQNLSGT